MGLNLGSHQEGIRVSAPLSSSSFLTLVWGSLLSAQPSPGQGSAQSLGRSHAAAPSCFYTVLPSSKAGLMLWGRHSANRVGTEGHGGELVQTGVNWCVAGKGKAKGKARQKE